jgi:hypothetical protein
LDAEHRNGLWRSPTLADNRSRLAGHGGLPLAPMRMAERIERVFTAPTLEERVRTGFELIRDALALAPTSAGIERARATIRECPAQSDESR